MRLLPAVATFLTDCLFWGEEVSLLKLFISFPDGWPGVGLLLLRLTVAFSSFGKMASLIAAPGTQSIDRRAMGEARERLQSLQLRLLASGTRCGSARQCCHHRLPDNHVHCCRVSRSGRALAGCLPFWASRNRYPGGTPIPRHITPKSRGAADTPSDYLKSLQSRDAMIVGNRHTSNNSTNKHRPTTTDAGWSSCVTVSDPPTRND